MKKVESPIKKLFQLDKNNPKAMKMVGTAIGI